MPDQPNDGKPTNRYIIPALGIGVVLIVLALIGPCLVLSAIMILLAPAPIYFNTTGIVPECTFDATIMAFEDVNANQLRDEGEMGIQDSHVTVTLEGGNMGESRATDTNADGIAEFHVITDICGYPRKVTVTVDAPPGYTATTPLVYGPDEAAFIDQIDELHVGFQKTE